MDGDDYDDLRSHFTLLCGTEMDTCLAVHKLYSTVWESVAKVCVYMCRQHSVSSIAIGIHVITEISYLPVSLTKALTIIFGGYGLQLVHLR